MMDRKFYKKVAMIAIPVALQGLVSSSLTLLDNMMVSSLSETALSSVNLGVQLFNIQWMMVFGFCTGCSTFLTQLWGARETDNIKRVMGFAVVVTGFAVVPGFAVVETAVVCVVVDVVTVVVAGAVVVVTAVSASRSSHERDLPATAFST